MIKNFEEWRRHIAKQKEHGNPFIGHKPECDDVLGMMAEIETLRAAFKPPVIFVCTRATPFKNDQDQMGGTIMHAEAVIETKHLVASERWDGKYGMPSSYVVMHCPVCDKRWSLPYPLNLSRT